MGYLSQKMKASRKASDSAITDLLSNSRIDTLIGLPSWQGGLEPDTQQCLDHMCQYNIIAGNKVSLSKSTGSLIAENRNRIIEIAIEIDARYVLFIDTDMVFPKDAIQRMQMHGKPVVSAVAFVKSPPYMPNMYKKVALDGWTPIREWKDGELMAVDCVGGAFMLCEVSALKRIHPPWFAQPPMRIHIVWEELEKLFAKNPDDEQILKNARELYDKLSYARGTIGEDYYFSEMLRRANIPLYVDTSLKIGHIGKYTFSNNDFVEQKESGAFVRYRDLDKLMGLEDDGR